MSDEPSELETASTIPDDRAADGPWTPGLDRPEEQSRSSMPFGLPRLTANRTVLTYGADRFGNRSRQPSAIDPARSLMVSILDSRFAPLPLPVFSLPASVANSRLDIPRDGRAYAGGQFWKRCVACERVR